MTGNARGGVKNEGRRVRGPLGDLDIAELRHPTESSRFALALLSVGIVVAVAVFVLVSLGRVAVLMIAVGIIVVAVTAVWVATQLWRIRLLGDAVLVSAQTLPEVHGVLATVRDRLQYTRRVDLFVVDKISRVLSGDTAPITLTSLFGVHVLVAEGEALGDLADETDRQRLLFTLATYVGALKARYAQWWSPLFMAFQMTGLTTFVLWLVYPYYRATVFSGDRIAYACCGDLGISLDAVYRSLVGKDVAAHLRADGLTAQALTARRNRLLRLSQLLRATPLATSRYLNLLAFVRHRTPYAFDRYRPLFGATAPYLEPVLVSMSRRRSRPHAPAVATAVAGVLLLAGVLIGVSARNSPVALTLADVSAVVLGSDPAEAAPAPDDSAAPTGAAPVPTRPARAADPAPAPRLLHPQAVQASAWARSSRDDSGRVVTFGPGNTIDGDAGTAWRVPGAGIGQKLRFIFGGPVHLTAVGLIPGYAKLDGSSGTDRFTQNRRVVSARLSFESGSVDFRYADERTMQTRKVDVDTSVVEVTILSSSTSADRDFTAISEVAFTGWPL